MNPAASLAAALAWLGRHGTQGFALSIFLGLALPQFSAMARPALPITIFCFTTVVFMRLDMSVTLGLLRRPAKLAASCAWLIAGPALLIGGALLLVGRENLDPGIVLGLAIMGAAPPIMSSPAVAILYGFEPSLIIASVILTTIVSPIVAPILVELLAGAAVPLDRWALTLRLLIFIGGGMAVAAVIRFWLGLARVKAMKANLDGFGVLMYFIFAIAAMDGVTKAALDNPRTRAVRAGMRLRRLGGGVGVELAGAAAAAGLRALHDRLWHRAAEHGPARRGAGSRRLADDLPLFRAGAVPDLPAALAAWRHRGADSAPGGC
ncbi:hypothetical protein [Bosea sp. UC22_33]|uniref:hypothetical protein n=1 Tax=Bosea sp. UC22_33 TaxID=3350165 RepID=UPI0036734F23